MKYLAWDLEVARLGEFGKEPGWGISCVGFCTDAQKDAVVPNYTLEKHLQDAFESEDVGELVDLLEHAAAQGRRLITWNGAAFDWRVLCEEADHHHMNAGAHIRRLALGSIDPAFQMHCEMGYMIGLQTAANACGLPGKVEGMSGVLAPILWNGEAAILQEEAFQDELEQARMIRELGSREARCLVVDYVRQDATALASLYEALCARSQLYWTTAKDKRSYRPWVLRKREDGHMLTVEECLRLPEPDTSWMTNPRSRRDLVGWILGD